MILVYNMLSCEYRRGIANLVPMLPANLVPMLPANLVPMLPANLACSPATRLVTLFIALQQNAELSSHIFVIIYIWASMKHKYFARFGIH